MGSPMTRREFLEGVSLTSILAPYPEATRELFRRRMQGHPAPRLLPKALKAGMTVGLVAPSSPLFEPDGYRMAEDRVKSLGLVPKLAPRCLGRYGYLAGADADRAADLRDMFLDPKVDAIWCLRGGYGALRILPLIDFEAVRAHPKVFVGYSDVTALHLAFQKLTGLVTFHGPMLSSNLSPYALEELQRVLQVARPAGIIGAPSEKPAVVGQVDSDWRRVTLRGGRAKGPLVGGNLSLVTRLLGTPFEPDLEGSILFLEDVGEAPYRVDGMLSQLRLSGKLQGVHGLVFGRFTDAASTQPVQLPLETVLRDLTQDLQVPVLFGWAVGHVADQTMVPYGITAELDADAGTVALTEAAVA